MWLPTTNVRPLYPSPLFSHDVGNNRYRFEDAAWMFAQQCLEFVVRLRVKEELGYDEVGADRYDVPSANGVHRAGIDGTAKVMVGAVGLALVIY
jgi:hypothetical protein